MNCARRAFAPALLALLTLAAPLPSQGAPSVVFEDDDLDARTKDLLSRYANQVRTWGFIQRVAQAAVTGNAESPTPAQVAERAARWQEGRSSEFSRRVLESDCSEALQTLLAANAGYAEAFVLNRDGRVVCMSRQTPRYVYGAVPGWDAAVARGDLWVSAARPSDNPELEMIQIVVPVLSAGEVVGGLVASKLVPKL